MTTDATPPKNTDYIDLFIEEKNKQNKLIQAVIDKENEKLQKLRQEEKSIMEQKEYLAGQNFKARFKRYQLQDNKDRDIVFYIKEQKLLIDFSENDKTLLSKELYKLREMNLEYEKRCREEGHKRAYWSWESYCGGNFFSYITDWSALIVFKDNIDVYKVVTSILSKHSYEELFLISLSKYVQDFDGCVCDDIFSGKRRRHANCRQSKFGAMVICDRNPIDRKLDIFLDEAVEAIEFNRYFYTIEEEREQKYDEKKEESDLIKSILGWFSK